MLWLLVQRLDQLKQTVCSQTSAANTDRLRETTHVTHITVSESHSV